MTPYRLLERLLELEQRVRRVYIVLSQRQQFSAELRVMWNAMAEDEMHHIVTLERSAHLFSVMDTPPTIPDYVLASVQATIATAEATAQQLSLTSDQAFHQALMIEGSELNRLDEAWVHAFRSTTSLLLQTLAPQTPTHIRRLTDAVHRFSTNTTVLAEADALWAQYEKPRQQATRVESAR